MAWTHETIEVGTSATPIRPATVADNPKANTAVIRTDASEAVYLGGAGVTTATGVQLAADTVYELDLSDGPPYLVAGVATDHNVAFGRARV